MLLTACTLIIVGVAVGTEFCGAESPAVRDSDFWVVTIGEYGIAMSHLQARFMLKSCSKSQRLLVVPESKVQIHSFRCNLTSNNN